MEQRNNLNLCKIVSKCFHYCLICRFITGSSTPIRHISLRSLIPNTDAYMTYEGSTTHPGCWESAVWIILNKPIYITKQEVLVYFFSIAVFFTVISASISTFFCVRDDSPLMKLIFTWKLIKRFPSFERCLKCVSVVCATSIDARTGGLAKGTVGK